MATRKDSVYLAARVKIEEDKIRILEARKTDPARQTPYKARDAMTVTVRSISNPTNLWYRVPTSEESIQKVAGGLAAENIALLGLVLPTAIPAGNVERTNKYRTFDYPKILIIHGTGSPTRVLTEWGTKWTKKYAKDGSQSHRLIPFGCPPETVTPTFDEVVDYFQDVFGMDGTTAGILRGSVGLNGSVSLVLGKNSVVETITT